ncbi:phage major capsid protein, P2 family [Marinobacter oulmenensis]|uniref:P2 family phage major capsid protein n=1 Tax=Marinobacter oulmenensis TaxID=643747 RepID=A0A840UB43_9GAMM|nr:phage major capsid protein, P2 family [Marinobacter oulmenensis]MBB5320480.1 P2 family phage major capsid protein [Marinobacter oulmenensis]
MRNESRVKFNQLRSQIAKLNQVESAAEMFAVTPTAQQTLETRMQESAGFLSQINVIGVDEIKGEKVGLGVSSTIAGRTDTTAKEREPNDVADLNSNTYECVQTNFDTTLRYKTIDAWAKFPDFQVRVRNAILRRQALDRIMIGFNGTSVAAETDRQANPMLQDVNKGWLQKYRENKPENVLSEVVDSSGKVNVGSTGDYKNLDALVFDVTNNMIDPWHQEDPSLVVLVGRDLMADKYFPIIDQDNAPTEQVALQMIVSQKRMGNLQVAQVPFMPAGAMMITTLDNLSIYYQIGSRRRQIIDNPKRDRIENFESSNDDYVVEDYGLGAVVENITLV